MSGVRIVIPGTLPGQNEIIAAAKARWRGGGGDGYTSLKRQWTGIVATTALAQVGRRKLKFPITLHFHWVEPTRRRDPDNFTGGGRKLVLDGLVKMGLLPNDGWSQVAGFSDSWEKGSPARVEVTIEEGGLATVRDGGAKGH